VGHAYEKAQKSFLRCLLRDFQSMSADEYTNDFCDDGLVILFNIFKECEVSLARFCGIDCSSCLASLKEIEVMYAVLWDSYIGYPVQYLQMQGGLCAVRCACAVLWDRSKTLVININRKSHEKWCQYSGYRRWKKQPKNS